MFDSHSSSTSSTKFLTKLLVGIFLSIAFLATAVTVAVWSYKSRARRLAEANEMRDLEESARFQLGFKSTELVRLRRLRGGTGRGW
jgi:cell division protein FtsL